MATVGPDEDDAARAALARARRAGRAARAAPTTCPVIEAARYEAVAALGRQFAADIAPLLGRSRWWTAFEDWLHARRHACRHGVGAEPARASSQLDPVLPTGEFARADPELSRKLAAAGVAPDVAARSCAALATRSEELARGVRDVAARCAASGERGEVRLLTAGTGQAVDADADVDACARARADVVVACGAVALRCAATHWARLRWLFDRTAGPQAAADGSAERTFRAAAFCVLARYGALQGGHERAGGMQAAVPPQLLAELRSSLGVGAELFASPLNCLWPQFGSACADTDGAFGSAGSFFELAPDAGSFEVNPPFDDALIAHAERHMRACLEVAHARALPLSFCVVVPYRPATAGWVALTRSPFCTACVRLRSGEHSFTEGAQWLRPRMRPSPADSTLALLQTARASREWPFSEALRLRLIAAFAAPRDQSDGRPAPVEPSALHRARESGDDRRGPDGRKRSRTAPAEASRHGASDGGARGSASRAGGKGRGRFDPRRGAGRLRPHAAPQ